MGWHLADSCIGLFEFVSVYRVGDGYERQQEYQHEHCHKVYSLHSHRETAYHKVFAHLDDSKLLLQQAYHKACRHAASYSYQGYK